MSMKNPTTTHLSDCLRRAKTTWENLGNAFEQVDCAESLTEELTAYMQDCIDDLAFYLKEILEHSDPTYWTDEEFQWIEGIRAEFSEAA